MKPTQPPSVCILRLSSLGDVTHVVPTVRSLQRAWPGVRITWIVGRSESRLVELIPDIELVVYDKRRGLRALRDVYSRLRDRRFDILLHMQLSLRANLLSLAVRATRRIGYDHERAREMHGCFVRERIPAAAAKPQHVLDALHSFLVPLGITPGEVRWDFPIPDEARAWATEQLPGDQPTLIISPCSRHIHRQWHPGGYATIADHAIMHHGFRVALVGGPSEREREMGTAIAGAAGRPLLNLMGRDTLPRLLALLERADVILSPDSGPAHLANAVGTPVIALHACTDSRRSGPYSDQQFCVDHFADAARRFAERPPEQLRWGTRIERHGVMGLVSEPAVIAAFERYVASRRVVVPA